MIIVRVKVMAAQVTVHFWSDALASEVASFCFFYGTKTKKNGEESEKACRRQ
jgi:hypothetical protein